MLDRRRGVCAAVIATGSLILAGQANAAQQPTIKLKFGIEKAQLEQLRAQQQSTQAAPAQPGKRARGEAAGSGTLSLLRGAALSRDNAAPAGPTAMAAPIGEQPDGTARERCFGGSGVESQRGRIHNRFVYCQRVQVVAEYWEIDNTGVPVELEGTTTANLEVFTQGDDHARRVRTFARIQKDSVDYDWGPIDNIFVAPNVPLSMIGQCAQSFDVCHATRGPATMAWTTWDNNEDWYYWDVYNHEDAAEGRDKIGYNQWYVELFTDSSEYQTLVRGKTNPRMLRCDSATYFNRGNASYPEACVFSEVTPHLDYQLGSDHHSVAFHIFNAQSHPNATYPLLTPPGVPAPRDKRIPGEYVAGDPDAPGLHRITQTLHPGEYKANSDHKDGACYKRGPHRDEYLDTGLPTPPNTPDEQCDEYPFASTLEGAGNPYWDFSVMAVPQRDNSVAGALLSNYYVDDRILAWDADLDRPDETNDRFYVHIE